MATSTEMSNTLLALSNNLADAVEQASQVVVAVNARQRMSSSGVHWQQGVVVTADHTVKRDEEITVTLLDNRNVSATLVGRDSSTDLAVLKLSETELPTAEICDAASLKVGHIVLALGRSSDGITASYGVISALGSAWRTWSGGQIDQFVRPDLRLYPGFSGGPLVDISGRVIGINTSGLARRMDVVIPASTINRVVDQLLARGRIARGYLGVGMQPVRLPDTLKSKLNLPALGGVIVVNVELDGPAEKAGVLIGDVLVALDGTSISDTGDVLAMLVPERVGKTISAQIIRGGTLIEVAIAVGERPRS
jgi:S1-C subfamily serine protease